MTTTMITGRRRWQIIFLTIVFIVVGYGTLTNWYQIHNVLSYSTRPLWDTPDGPRHILPHYYSEGVDVNQQVCKLHGWDLRDTSQSRELWDAILFNNELDFLEIRLHELDVVVDKFFIIESNRTFTGIHKDLTFSQHRYDERFKKFENKIVYKALPGPLSLFPLGSPQSIDEAWEWESAQRDAMSELIKTRLHNVARPPIVVFSDIDELPSPQTLFTLKQCDFVSPIHLQLRNYMYSFEWPYGWGSWRAQVHVWEDGKTFYRHSKSTDVALADSGWHCSFCFRNLHDFKQKMIGFSHADRLGGDISLLSSERIQRVICEGKDIFNMLPEAYSYKDMIQLFNPEPSKSAVNLPKYLIENADRFKYLLPGGCERES